MEYLKSLVDEINTYDGTDEATNRLRDLVCYLSDKEEYQKDPLSRSILFDAAQVMRTFGYNFQNKITIDEIWNNSGLNDIRQQAIQNYYSSKVYANNIIDKRQKEIIDLFNSLETKRLIVSAPTSFGKTFILREILYLNHDRYNNVLLVFPTVALLNENTLVINQLINNLELDYTVINNVYSKVDTNNRNIYILTPERTLKLLADYDNLNIDFFFFDEVYKIDEDLNRDENSENPKSRTASSEDVFDSHDIRNRARAFRIALYILSKIVNEYYIAGPYLNLDNVKPGFKQYLSSNNITAKQIAFEPTLRIEVDAWAKKGKEIDPFLGDIQIDFNYDGKPITTKSKVKAIISYLKDNNLGQAIIYCSTPGHSMDYAKEIISNLDHNTNVLQKYGHFIQHLKRRYGIQHTINGRRIVSSDYWSLISILSAGFGVHHGKFPKYIQKEILNIFNSGDMDYLFCTSTIIEGVNTNAKNVLIVNNSVGTRTMTSFALKNIRGRAGRYYHHFIGRVFYADKKQREIASHDDIELNFSIYDDIPIKKIDFDNAEIGDLSNQNRVVKTQREETFDKNKLPDNVFIRNRLYARDVQEEYLSYLIANIDQFKSLINEPGNIPFFLKNNMMNSILESLTHVGIITDSKRVSYWAISDRYCKRHFEGLMEYQLGKTMKNLEGAIDKAYLTVFTQIRNIIEYEIPQLLSLFESLFKQACTLNGDDVDDFDMSSIIRFFELGVRTSLGLYLVEYGFPVDAIRDIENILTELSQLELQESLDFIRNNISRLNTVLDEYEKGLLGKAIGITDA